MQRRAAEILLFSICATNLACCFTSRGFFEASLRNVFEWLDLHTEAHASKVYHAHYPKKYALSNTLSYGELSMLVQVFEEEMEIWVQATSCCSSIDCSIQVSFHLVVVQFPLQHLWPPEFLLKKMYLYIIISFQLTSIILIIGLQFYLRYMWRHIPPFTP